MAGAFLPLSKHLSRRFQHVLDEDPVPHRGIIHKDVRHRSNELSVLNNR